MERSALVSSRIRVGETEQGKHSRRSKEEAEIDYRTQLQVSETKFLIWAKIKRLQSSLEVDFQAVGGWSMARQPMEAAALVRTDA